MHQGLVLFIFHVYLDATVSGEWHERCCRGGHLSGVAASEQRRIIAERTPTRAGKYAVSDVPLVSRTESGKTGSTNMLPMSDGSLPTARGMSSSSQVQVVTSRFGIGSQLNTRPSVDDFSSTAESHNGETGSVFSRRA